MTSAERERKGGGPIAKVSSFFFVTSAPFHPSLSPLVAWCTARRPFSFLQRIHIITSTYRRPQLQKKKKLTQRERLRHRQRERERERACLAYPRRGGCPSKRAPPRLSLSLPSLPPSHPPAYFSPPISLSSCFLSLSPPISCSCSRTSRCIQSPGPSSVCRWTSRSRRSPTRRTSRSRT